MGLVLVILFGENMVPHAGQEPVPLTDWILLFLFPFATVLGMALAWRLEAFGGAISTASFVIFIMLLRTNRGELIAWPGLAAMLLVALPGFLFLACWYLSRGEPELFGSGEI